MWQWSSDKCSQRNNKKINKMNISKEKLIEIIRAETKRRFLHPKNNFGYLRIMKQVLIEYLPEGKYKIKNKIAGIRG